MLRISSATAANLYDIATTRRIEEAATKTLPPHTLMQRAGLAVARLAMALTPHASVIWIACGPGNNGGDGFEAACQLQARGFRVVVTRIGDDQRLPPDAQASLKRAQEARVEFDEAPPTAYDLAVDALLGIGAARRPPAGLMLEWLREMNSGAAPVLSVDTPSGLDADTGMLSADFLPTGATQSRRVCLSLLTLKPGLFTAQGRDAAGEVWFDDLDVSAPAEPPAAKLLGAPASRERPHASHKGSYGDVAVIGGAPGMAGAALLAASAALHAGAGRVFIGLLDGAVLPLDPMQPELMFRQPDTLDLAGMTVVCGCGGGSVVGARLPQILQNADALVLDADALNCIAADPGMQSQLRKRSSTGLPTVLTPHPLEAARLLGCSTSEVQRHRLAAARTLATRFETIVVLKGSGTIVTGPHGVPVINPTGNARLATAGTGDVLAGMVGAALAAGRPALAAACEAAWRHGNLADQWPAGIPLTAGALTRGNPPAALFA